MDSQKKGAPRILVIEDEPVTGLVCRRVLGRQGFWVEVAGDGEKAIESLRRNHYDLCIMNERLSGAGGMELYRYLAEHRPALSHSMVFTTGDISGGRVPGLLDSSEKVYLEKPFTPRELITAVEMALN